MIADWDINTLQDHKKIIEVQSTIGLIFTFEGPRTPFNLLGQPDQNLGFANITLPKEI